MLKIIYYVIMYKKEKKNILWKNRKFFQKLEIDGNYMSQIFFKKQKSMIKDYFFTTFLTTFQNYIK